MSGDRTEDGERIAGVIRALGFTVHSPDTPLAQRHPKHYFFLWYSYYSMSWRLRWVDAVGGMLAGDDVALVGATPEEITTAMLAVLNLREVPK